MVTADQSRSATVPSTWADPAPVVATPPLWRRALPLVVWLTCLGVAVVLLLALGGGRLAAPALTDPGSWPQWAAGRDPLEVVMVALRLFALAVAWYLTGVTSVSVLARLVRAARLVRLADALSVGPVKVVVQQALGIGLATGIVVTAVPGVTAAGRSAASDPRADVVVMSAVPESGDDSGEADVVPVGAVPVPAPPASSSPSPSPTPSPTPSPAVAPAAVAPPTGTQQPELAEPASPTPTGTEGNAEAVDLSRRHEVRVRSGDHFWAISERAVAAHLGRTGSEEEVLAHWQATVAANADRLVVASNPDLLLPGQVVVVPAVAEVLS